MSRWSKAGLYFSIAVFLLTSLWMRGLSYSCAVTYNHYQAQAVSGNISPEHFQELPQLPFVFYPTFSNFIFSTAEALCGLYSEGIFAQTIYLFPLLKSFIEKPSVLSLHSSPPIFIRIRSLRY
ncbi:MAG TPA: hypothetical protein VJ855_00815 [Marinilabiliaceae bacterium]|nr:hypothetical protein [Marinilabiliaceae bacterium]